MSNLSDLLGGGGGSTGIGAIAPDSFVAPLTLGYTLCASPSEIDAGHSFTHEGNYMDSVSSKREGVCYSSYHGAWFCQGSNMNNSDTTSNRCVYKSYDGIHWTAIFKLSQDINTSYIPSNLSTANAYSFLVVDDSNGRLWIAGTEQSGSYRLRMFYYDFDGDWGNATEVFATGDTGNSGSLVEYMQWLPNTEVILIFYRNSTTSGQLKKAYILAGGTTITWDQTFSPGSGQEYRYGFAIDDTNNKYYIQNDSTKAFYYSGSSPHTANWTQITKTSGSATAFNENGQMAMGGGYIIFVDNDNLYYMDTTSTWSSSTGWSYNGSALPTNGHVYACYYDETNSRFVGIGTYGIFVSSTPNTGAWTWKAASGLGTVSMSGDLKATRAHS